MSSHYRNRSTVFRALVIAWLTTITLQQASGDWRISILFNELVAEAQPIVPSPNATEAE